LILFEIFWTDRSRDEYHRIKQDASLKKRYKAVKKTIELLSSDPRHRSLQTHEFSSIKGPNMEKVFVAYAEQQTPAAYRVFWYYGPLKGQITILAITKHP